MRLNEKKAKNVLCYGKATSSQDLSAIDQILNQTTQHAKLD
jgi:hypothetical protein